MASSSDEALDDSIPEMVYQCTSLIDGTGNRKEDAYLKCPLCNHFSRGFYCTDCIRNGNFTHSQKKCFERFADKKPKKYKLDEERNAINMRYEEIFAKKKEAENIKINIMRSRERIHLLKQSLEARKKEMEKDAKAVKAFQEKSKKLKLEQVVRSEKITKLKSAYKEVDDDTVAVSKKLSEVQSAFKASSQIWICELKSNIFPIIKTPLPYHRNATSSEEGQCAELEEAQKTTYVQGQWVITGSPIDDIQYAIVDVLVPSTGDYSSYTNWCAEHEPLAIYRGDWSNLDRHHYDIAYGISSGLAYAAQLVNVLAFYLDVHVPKRSTFNDFCRCEDVTKFSHHVAKLNANIVHLCLHRNVEVTKLSAHRTMPNLMLIFDPDSQEIIKQLSHQDKDGVVFVLAFSMYQELRKCFRRVTQRQKYRLLYVLIFSLHQELQKFSFFKKENFCEEDECDIEVLKEWEFITHFEDYELSLQEKEERLESLEDSICKDLLTEESDDESDADFEYIKIEEVPKTEAPASTSTLFSSVVSSIYRVAIGRR